MKFNTKLTIFILGILLFLLISIYNSSFIHARFITGVIYNVDENLRKGNVEELKSFFASDGKIVYNNQEILYLNALNNFKKRIEEGKLSGSLYVGEHENVSVSNATIRLVARFKIEGNKWQIAPVAELKNTGLFSWKIQKLRSDEPAFGYAFFNAAVPRDG